MIGALAATLFGAFTTVIAATLVYAACAEALDRIDEGDQPDGLDAYRGIVPRLLPLTWTIVRITIVAAFLVVTLIGIPVAIVYLIRKALTVQSIVIEERGSTSGLKRSGELVRGHELRVLAIAGLLNGTVALLGPAIGVALMFVTSASLSLINLVSSLVYVFVLPAVGIGIALLFFDLRIRKEGEQAVPATGHLEVTIVVMDEGAASERAILERALEIRRRRHLDGKIEVRLATSPGGFVAGEETAVVNLLNGREAKPTFKPPLPFQRGVSGSPTLVQNVETLAHIALIARHGSDWFREVGTAEQPGTALLTVTGAVGRPGVYEVAFGTPLVSLLFDAGGVREEPQAFLVGGYFGTWVPATSARSLDLSETSLQERGAALGAGALAVLPASACGLVETARVTRYLATESAGQCGPCVHGLDAIARALESLALPTGAPTSRLEGWLEQVRGRGACRHPDGTVRFVASALEAFAAELEHHVRGRCSGHGRAVLPLDKRSR